MRRFLRRSTHIITLHQEDTKTLATELSEELFPKIRSSEDVNVGDEVILAPEVYNTNGNGTRLSIMKIEADRLLIQEKTRLETYIFYVGFKDVRLNPYYLHWCFDKIVAQAVYGTGHQPEVA
jgi:hypothetical protein